MIGSEVRAVLARLRDAYGDELPEPAVAVWQDRLRRYEYEQALAAADRIIDSSKTFPTVAEFIRAIVEHERAERRKVEDPRLVEIETRPSCPRCGKPDEVSGVRPPVTVDDRDLAFHCSPCRLIFEGSEREWLNYAEERLAATAGSSVPVDEVF